MPDGLVVATEIALREERLARLAEAKAVLEARAKGRDAIEQAEDEDKVREREAKARRKGKRPRGRPPTPSTPGPLGTDQYNFTDPESRIRSRTCNPFHFDAHAQLYRLTGLDLTRIDGIDSVSALTILGKIGTDMSRWKSVKHFVSWLGLCPGTKVSGGRVLGSKSKPTANRAASALRLAAASLSRSRSARGAYLRRMSARLGKPQAITATAHKLAQLVYSMLKHGTEYVDVGQDYYERQHRERVVHNLTRRAKELGFVLIPAPAQEAVT